MNYIADSICLLNSSYSKDKIIKIFKATMLKLGIKDFVLSSGIVQVFNMSSSIGLLNSQIALNCGNHDVFFKYISTDEKLLANKKDIECVIAAFIVAIENSMLYKDIIDNVIFSKDKEYLSYNDLISDISHEIKNYERFGTNFCVAKIVIENLLLGEKFNFKISQYINQIKDSIRGTDTVYRDSKNIYVLFRNVDLNNGITLINKIKNIVYTNSIGIAQWQSSFVIVDLMSEIDNYIYLSQVKYEEEKNSLADELNKVLNKALYKNHDIYIIEANKLNSSHKNNIELKFILNNIEYIVLRTTKKKADFSYVYKFVGDELAEDIIGELSKL